MQALTIIVAVNEGQEIWFGLPNQAHSENLKILITKKFLFSA